MNPTTTANGLTAHQIEEYRENGFLVIDNVFNPPEVDALREMVASPEVTKLLEVRGHANQAVHLLELTTLHPLFMELAKDRRIVERIIPLLGPDIQLQHSKLATKPPTKGAGPFAWHQDLAFYPHTNDSLLSVMVMLDDATPQNGCMSMVRGSHKLGILDHSKEGLFAGACTQKHLWEDASRCAQITPRSGGISIHHCLTLHGSPANLSGHPRRGIVFSYRADDAYQLSDCICQDTGILINGKRRERVRCDIGKMQLPKRLPDNPYYSGSAFGNAWNQVGAQVDEEEFFQA